MVFVEGVSYVLSRTAQWGSDEAEPTWLVPSPVAEMIAKVTRWREWQSIRQAMWQIEFGIE
jgi:hypothetical protein